MSGQEEKLPELPPLTELFDEAFDLAIKLDRPDLVRALVEEVARLVGAPTL